MRGMEGKSEIIVIITLGRNSVAKTDLVKDPAAGCDQIKIVPMLP